MNTNFFSNIRENNKLLGRILRQKRDDKKLTMRNVATTLNKPHSLIGKTEKQSRRLDVGEFISYCDALGQNPKLVFGELVDAIKTGEAVTIE